MMLQTTHSRVRSSAIRHGDTHHNFVCAWRIRDPCFDRIKMRTDEGSIFMPKRHIDRGAHHPHFFTRRHKCCTFFNRNT